MKWKDYIFHVGFIILASNDVRVKLKFESDDDRLSLRQIYSTL